MVYVESTETSPDKIANVSLRDNYLPEYFTSKSLFFNTLHENRGGYRPGYQSSDYQPPNEKVQARKAEIPQ